MERLKVGLLLPCYNVAPYLKETFQSINSLILDTIDFNIYALDDNSSDGTFEFLQKVVYPTRLFQNDSNNGWCASYNELANVAIEDNCEYIMIMGSDDQLEPSCLQEMIKLLKETESDFCIVQGQMFGDGNIIMTAMQNATWQDFREANQIPNFALIKSEMWNELNGYDTSFRYADWEFWIRALKANKKYCVVEEPLYRYRLHAGNDHKKTNLQYEHNLIINKHFI